MATIQGQLNTPRDSTFKSTESTPRNLADVLAEELAEIAGAIGNVGTDDYDDLSHRPKINSVILTGDKSADDLSLAMQEDLTSIKVTGTTNATGSTITSGTYFYLNGTLVQAKVDIAVNAAFTLNTNYEVVTAGGLNSLNSALSPKSFSKTMYGISYQLVQIGKLVIVSAWSGTTSTALNAQDVLITLGAFDSSLSGKTFIIDIPTTNTTNTSMRMGMDINTGNIKTYTSIGSGTALRFFLVGVIN